MSNHKGGPVFKPEKIRRVRPFTSPFSFKMKVNYEWQRYDYKEAKEAWELARATSKLLPKFTVERHVTSGMQFVTQLVNLSFAADDDPRFQELYNALVEHDLIDQTTCRWKKGLAQPSVQDLNQRMKKITINGVNDFVAEGRSHRQAFALIAAAMRVEANSFEAAVKMIERIWRSERRKSDDALGLDK
jgi:hypothetical protein